MKISLLILITSFSLISFGQTSNAVFTGLAPFRISVNKVLQQKEYITSLNLTNLSGERHYNLKIEFENDTTVIQQNIYIMDNGFAYYFNVSKTALTLKKITPNQLLPNDSNQLTLAYLNNKIITVDTVQTDTLTKIDTAYSPPFEYYYKMENYNGKIACPWPIKPEVLTNLKGDINTQTLEDSKLEIAKEKAQYIDSLCITVDQLREVLILFEYEETKLDFAKHIAPHIFDIDNIGKLNDVFDFENSIDELRDSINNN